MSYPVAAGARYCKWEAKIMKKAIFLTLLSLTGAGSTSFAESRLSIGKGGGGYGPGNYAPPPPASAAPVPYDYDDGSPVSDYESTYQPPCPGPASSWVGGYWFNSGNRRLWRVAYCSSPAYRGYGGSPYYST